MALWNGISQLFHPGISPASPALQRILNRWTPREVPGIVFKEGKGRKVDEDRMKASLVLVRLAQPESRCAAQWTPAEKDKPDLQSRRSLLALDTSPFLSRSHSSCGPVTPVIYSLCTRWSFSLIYYFFLISYGSIRVLHMGAHRGIFVYYFIT